MYNDYMYAIDRSDEYLEHYGIKGMKWGVRKAIDAHNTKALLKHYRKAQKKLAKLNRRANNGAKYAKRAAALGAGAAAAGGLAALGTSGVASGMAKLGAHGGNAMVRGGRALSKAGGAVSGALYKAGVATGNSTLKKIGAHGGNAMIKTGNALNKAGSKVSSGLYTGSTAVRKWGNSNSIGNSAANAVKNANAAQFIKEASGRAGVKNLTSFNTMKANTVANNKSLVKLGKNNAAANKLAGVSNNAIARAGAAALGAGLAGAAGYNAYRAATTKRAAKKAEQFRKEMNETFKGTGVQKLASKDNRRRRRRG